MRSSVILAIGVIAVTFSVGGCKKKIAVKAPDRVPVVEQSRATPTVTAPRTAERTPDVARTPAPAPGYPTDADLLNIKELLSRIQDAYFDYDKHMIRPDAEQALRENAQTLATIIKRYPDFKLAVEGHCDERGSDEYNLALGDARAQKAKEYLVSLGLPATQLNTVSFGKQKPVCTDSDEGCWQKNRRAHLEIATLGPGR